VIYYEKTAFLGKFVRDKFLGNLMGYNFPHMKFFQKNRFLEENDGDPESVQIGNFFCWSFRKGLETSFKKL
jgi:hypothetical protein